MTRIKVKRIRICKLKTIIRRKIWMKYWKFGMMMWINKWRETFTQRRNDWKRENIELCSWKRKDGTLINWVKVIKLSREYEFLNFEYNSRKSESLILIRFWNW